MPSTYTGLGVQLMETGEKAGTWGTLTNTNWNIIEQISGGYVSIACNTTGATTLAVSDGAATDANQVGHRVINLTAALAGNITVTIPLDVQQLYIIKNATTNAYTVQFKYVSGSGSSVTWGTTDKGTKILYATANDATNPDIVDTGFLSSVVDDTSPQLGGNLDCNGNDIVSTSDADIDIIPNGTGDVNLGADTVQVGDNDANATITTQGTGDLILNTNNGTNAGNITLADGANGDITITPDGTGVAKAVDGADATGAIKIAGKETMWVPAQAMYAETTNGAELAQTVLTGGAPELKAFAFDASTAEAVQFNVSFPESWNAGTVTFQTMWSASSTDTGTGGFTLAGCSVASDVDYDLAFGTPVANTALAASGTQDDLMVNVESGGVTIASAAASTNTIFRLVRDTGTDTNTGDLRLVGIKIYFTTNAANDA